MINNDDTYKTIVALSEGTYSEKRSKFIALAVPVTTVDDVKKYLTECQKKYFDARHLCYAYKLGVDGLVFRANDNGEPSGTAGKPILGQINSLNLTDVLVVVVRYFGGIKLGTSGLIVAYRTAASEALANAQIIEKTVDETISFRFEYLFLNEVMKVVKELSPETLFQEFDMDCIMKLRIRKSLMPVLKNRLEKIETLHLIPDVYKKC
ncbi:MAG: YigZ family protein [Bacteroidales bacterium]|nr:YigZ family protein [Bacteroidales bacterium]